MTPSKRSKGGINRPLEDSADIASLPNEEFLQSILESTADGILVIGKDGKVVYANHRFIEMWRIPKVVMDSKDDETLLAFVLDQLQDPEAFLKKVRNLYESSEEDLDLINFKDGKVFERFSRPLLRDGKMAGRVWSFRDITERKKAEGRISSLSSVVKQSSEGMAIANLDGVLTFVNNAWCKMHGYESSKELLGKNLSIFHNEEQLENEVKPFNEKVKQDGAYSGEVGHITKDGRPFPTLMGTTILKDEQGKSYALAGIATDITERKQAEEALRESEDKYRTLVSHTPAVLWTSDQNGHTSFISSNVEQVYGYTPKEILEAGDDLWFGRIHSEDLPSIKTAYGALIERGELFDVEYRIKRKDGVWIWLQDRATRGYEAQGTIRVDGVFLDITERKKAEEDLRRAKEFTDTALDSQLDTFFLFELASGKAIRWNRAFRDITGYTDEEIARMPAPASYYNPGDLERAAAAIQKVMEGGAETIELELICKDGRKVPTEYRASAINDDNGEPRYLVSIGRDVTGRKKSEAALSEANDIINRSPAVAFLWKNEEGWPAEFVSENVENLSGYSSQEFMERKISFNEIIHNDDLERVLGEVARYSKNEGLQSFVHEPYRIITKSGDIKWINDNTYIRRDPRGIITHYEGIVYDITDRKLAEEALKESEQKYRLMTLNTLDTIWTTDLELNFTFVNDEIINNLGYTPEEFLGMNPADFTTPESMLSIQKAVQIQFARYKEGDISQYQFEVQHIKKDGKIIDVEITSKPLIDNAGEIIGFQGKSIDISQRKKVEEALRESEGRFRKLSSLTFEGILIHENGVVIDFNDSILSMTGYTREELIGANVFDKFITPEYQAIARENIIKQLTSSYEIIAKKKDETLFPVEVQARNTMDGGKVTRVVAVRDITERRKNEAALKESEQKFREMANLLPQVVFEADLSGKLTFVNEQAFSLFGYSRDDSEKGLNFHEMIIPEDRERAKENIMKVMRGEAVRNHEYTAKRKDGSIFPVMIYSNPVIKESGPAGLRGIVVDITERKQAEEALREREQLYHTLIHTTLEGYLRVDLDLITIDVNDSLCKMLGYSRQEIIGRHLFDLFDEDNLGILKEQTAKISSTKNRSYEIRVRKKSGENIPVNISATTLKDQNGNVTGSFGLITDMTRQKELTEKLLKANRDLKISERGTLNLLEDLSAENLERKIAEEEKEMEMTRAEFYLDLMGHDITNIHQGIYSWIQLAMHAEEEEEGFKLDLKVGENLVNRSIALVRNVQLLSGLKNMDLIFHPFELGALIEKTIHGVENIFVNKDVVINYEPPAEDVVIQAEPLIEELFLNLIHNGVKFQFGDKAVIDIELSASEKDGTVRFDISDHGPGIPDEMKKNLFDRFKRKDMKFHAGIGLSLVKELVDRYNGTIEVLDRIEGDHTKGARFVVTFPLGDRAPDSTIEA